MDGPQGLLDRHDVYGGRVVTPELRLRVKRTKSTAPPITHDLAMQRARAVLADLQHTRRDILTLRETIAMGGVR